MSEVENLENTKAVEKIKELAESADVCMFTTSLTRLPLSSRPMSTRAVDEEGNIWFFSRISSHKNEEISADDRVQLFYASRNSSEYLNVFGKASIIKDIEKAKELWSAMAKAWFNEGVDDPELTLIKVKPLHVYYWDTKHNQLVALIMMAASAVSGKEMDDGVEGTINVN